MYELLHPSCQEHMYIVYMRERKGEYEREDVGKEREGQTGGTSDGREEWRRH